MEVRIDGVAARIRTVRRPVTGALVAGLVALVAMHLASSVSETSLAATVHDQTDITAGMNLAAVFQCVLALVAALQCARIAWRARSSLTRTGWMAIAGGLTVTGVLEMTGTTGPFRAVPLAVAVLSVPFVVFIYEQTRHIPEARLLLALLLFLMLSNPITDGVERRITSNNDNYTFIAANEPYAFSSDAWMRLRIVSHIQEISEIAAIIVIVALTEALLAGPSKEAARLRQPSDLALRG